MGRRKYDKALGLEIEPIDDLKSYNPNIVSKDDGFSDLNIKDAKYEASTLGQLNAQSPYFQESVGQFFPSEKHAQYAEREELTPYDLNDINEVAFRNQGNWETLGNAFASRAISIIPKTLNMFGTVGGLVGAGAEYASDLANPNVEANWAMSASKNLDNAWVNAMNSFDEGLKDKFPVFGSKYGYYSGSLSDNIKSAKFWEEDGFDGLAFTASAMLPGMGMAKAFQLIGATAEGASMLGWLGRIGNAGATSEAALAAGTDIANTVTTGLINTTHEAGLEAYDWMKNLDENKTKQNLLSSDPELKSEINNLKNLQKEYESAPNELSFTGTDGRTIPTRKMLLAKKIDELTNSLEKNLDDKYKKFRAEGAANVANWNMAVLAGPDLFQAKMFTKAFGETSKLMNEASRSGERAVRASVLKNMGKEFAIGFGREGMWEENAQTSVSSYYNKKAYGETHLDDFDGILNEAVRNVTFQDKEGAKAIILGGASGGMTSAIFGGIDQKKKNLAADIQEKDFKKILEMSNTAVTDFYDRSKNILDADGNVSFENAVKAFTYTLGRKRNIDADQISTLYDNGTLNSLIKNDELARVFIEHMNMIGPRGFMNEAEAIESLKNKLQKNKDDQNPTDQSDAFASKIDLLKENYNKAKSIVEKNINNKHQESVDHKDLMVKTLFIALNKQSELSGILKDNDTVFNDKQKESISSLINDYSDAASHFTTRDGLTRVANGLSKAANEYNSIRKELDDELNKSEADRDMSKINSLEYQLEEISEISGTINKDINGADRKVNTYGYDSFRLAISPSDVINRTNLGIRDKFFYDLGKSKLAKSELNRLLSTEVPMKDQDGNDRSADDIFSDKLELAKSIFDFVSNDNIHYISSIMKDKVLSKLSELEESNNDKLMDIEDSMESFRGAISDLEIKKLQTPELYTDEDAENESKFRDELSMLNAQYADELSKEIDFSEEKEAIEDLYKNKDNTRNEFLGKEEEAHDNGYYTNIRKRIAKDFLSATNKLIKTISSDDSFSNVNLIKSKINEVSKRIDVFSNSEYHKDLIDGYVNDMLNLKQDLEKLLEIAESNKTNRDGLDLSLNHINNRNSLNQFGIDLNESGDVVIVDNSFVDKIIGIVGVDEWNSFLNDIKTIGLEGESIFVDKFIKNIESSKKVSIIEANDEKRNSLKSKLLNKLKDNFVVATNSGAEKFNNDLFESFLGNPERSM